jgi:hypothetical protein
MSTGLTTREIQAARAVAALADVLQFAIFPLVFQGFLSPVNVVVDLLMAAFFIWRLGWHWALLPAFVSELIPFWDLAPTWTVAVFIATRGREIAPPTDGPVIDTTAVPKP